MKWRRCFFACIKREALPEIAEQFRKHGVQVPELPGVLTYGRTREEAIDRVRVLSLRVLADRLDHGEQIPEMSGVFAVTP